jgi:hypothetical protein
MAGIRNYPMKPGVDACRTAGHEAETGHMPEVNRARRRLLAGLGSTAVIAAGGSAAAGLMATTATATSGTGDTVISLRATTSIVITYNPDYGFATRNDNWHGSARSST